jgi:hypothetical protein
MTTCDRCGKEVVPRDGRCPECRVPLALTPRWSAEDSAAAQRGLTLCKNCMAWGKSRVSCGVCGATKTKPKKKHKPSAKQRSPVPAATPQESLRRMEEQDFADYKAWLRRLEHGPAEHDPPEFERSDGGYPLGVGMPLGRSMREDGESHRQAWMRIIRNDPCAFCSRSRGGTVDHIEPKDPAIPTRGIGGCHSWVNYTSACQNCNSSKGSESLLMFLGRRAGVQLGRRDRPNGERAA